MPTHRETAVDGKTRVIFDVLRNDGRGSAFEGRAKVGESRTGQSTDCDHGRVFEKRSFDELVDFEARELSHVEIGLIGLVERDDAMPDAEQTADIEMLASLRHDRFPSRDDQHHEVDARRSREHILHESLMTGNVHEADAEVRVQIKMRKAEVDRDSAALFFLETIGVD